MTTTTCPYCGLEREPNDNVHGVDCVLHDRMCCDLCDECDHPSSSHRDAGLEKPTCWSQFVCAECRGE